MEPPIGHLVASKSAFVLSAKMRSHISVFVVEAYELGEMCPLYVMMYEKRKRECKSCSGDIFGKLINLCPSLDLFTHLIQHNTEHSVGEATHEQSQFGVLTLVALGASYQLVDRPYDVREAESSL